MKLLSVFVALLKQQGVGLKGASKSSPVNEEIPPLLEGGGKTEVWQSRHVMVYPPMHVYIQLLSGFSKKII